jgi:acyl-CoA thioesterase-2
MAACATVEGRPCHSLHCYFVRTGAATEPVRYEVDRVRDGAGFSVRQVTARQGERRIFILMASFQKPEPGPAHQSAMPIVPPPEDLVDEMDRWRDDADSLSPAARQFLNRPQRIEGRWVDPLPVGSEAPRAPRKALWVRAKEALPPTPELHMAALAYASDMTFISTALGVHGFGFWSPGLQSASLDHAVWFHQPTDFNAWHLYVQESSWTGGARGFVRGQMYRRDGSLVASMTQEGLIRLRP